MATATLRESFRDNKLFHGLPAGAVDALAGIPDVVELDADTRIFEEGERGAEMYLILRGSVRISKRGRGGQQETLALLRQCDHFGEMALFDDEPRSARAATVEHTALAVIDRDDLRRMLEEAPAQLHLNLIRETIRRLRNSERHLIDELLTAERLGVVGSMAAMVIHDLKNPLAVIKGATEMLEESSTSVSPARVAHLIGKSVQSMLRSMQDLLDFSRGSSSLYVEAFPISHIIDELEEQAFVPLSNRGILVQREFHATGAIPVDPGRFMRALLNIIRNAGEVMQEGGTLRLRIEREADHVVFTIADTGPGIPQDLLPRIFEPFVTRGKKLGTGLGLAIARAAVEGHHGNISVSTAAGAGTTFTVRMPG